MGICRSASCAACRPTWASCSTEKRLIAAAGVAEASVSENSPAARARRDKAWNMTAPPWIERRGSIEQAKCHVRPATSRWRAHVMESDPVTYGDRICDAGCNGEASRAYATRRGHGRPDTFGPRLPRQEKSHWRPHDLL